MANIKFSQFPVASSITGSETLVGLQSGVNSQFPVNLLATSGPIATALAGKQATLSAGSGISIVGNVISATGGAGTGTVTSVSVATANGFAGTVTNPTTTPAITLTTSVNGVVKGNGSVLSAAVSGTDYAPGTSSLATGILKSTTSTGVLSIAVAADFPTLNQNTTGTASNVTGVVALANGGTGQNTKTLAMNALSPTTTKGDIEVNDGTNVIRVGVGANGTVLTADSAQASGVRWASITGTGTVTSVDLTVPSFLSVTGGPITNAGTLAVSLSGAALPATSGGTGQNTYALGDILYASATNTLSKLAGQTSTTRNFLRQVGTGSASAAPAWDTVTKADVGLGAVENTALSTWAGSTNITTLGTIATGTWNGTTIAVNRGGTGLTSGINGGILAFTGTGTLTSSPLLATNGIILGGGVASTPQTVAGLVTDGISRVILGSAGSSVGGVTFNNATSGSITLSPVTGALGSVTLSLPALTGTVQTLDTLVDTVAGTTYTFVASDIGRHKVFTNAAGCSATVPAGLGATWNVTFAKAVGAGNLTFVQSGTTLINQSGSLVMSATNGNGAIIPTQTANTYTLEGIFGSSGAVTSVFGRTGAVTAQTGDYTFSQIGSTPTTLSGYGITNGQLGLQFQNSGSGLGTSGSADTLNFTGAGVTAARVGSTVTVTIPGGGSGAPVVENIPTGSAYTLVTGDANKIKRGVDTNPQTINITTAFNGLFVTIEWPPASGVITLDANTGVNLNGLGDGVNIVLPDTGGSVQLIPTGTNTWDVVGDLGIVASDITNSTTVGRSILTAADAAAVRTAAGVVIGTDVQAFNSKLSAISGLTATADSMAYFTGASTAAITALTAGGRALINSAGTANTFPYFSASNTVTLGSITTAGRNLLDDADAAAQRTTLSAQLALQYQSGGSNLGTAGTVDTVNFTGAGVSTGRAGNTVTVTISGGGGGGAPVVENIPTGSPYTLVTGDANKVKRAIDTNPQTINITTAFNGLYVTLEWPAASGTITLDAGAGVNLNGLGDGVNIVLADTGGAIDIIPTGTNTWDVVGAVGNLVAADITDSTTVGRSILTAADAAAVRTAAGVVIGTDVQAQDATLQALAGLTIAANSLTIGTGADAFSQTTFAANTFPGRSSTGNLVAKPMTDFGYSLVDDTDAATARTTLGLVIGTNVQAADATLTALAGLTIAANSLTIGTGADAFAQTTFAANTFPARASTGALEAKAITDFGLSLVDDASASAARTTLGLVIGTDVQAQNAYLTKVSAATPRQITSSTTLIATDVDCTIRANNASTITLTLADDATLTPVVGKSVITIFIEGAGVPTIAAGTATLLGSPRAGLAQNDLIVLVHTGIANTWVYA